MMQTPINKDSIRLFASSNVNILNGAPHALALEFHGLGDGIGIGDNDSRLGRYLAERGVIYAIPYYGPWAWMSDKAVRYVDEYVDAIFDLFGLEEGFPVVSTGLSMGGQGALVYCAASRHRIAACAANCPVCDLPYHYTEREDLPRTLYGAFSHYDMPLEEALKTASPLHIAEKMPDIPYLVIAAENDQAVSMKKHADPFVKKMRDLGRRVEYVVMPGRGHCDLSPEAVQIYTEFIASQARE